MRQFQRFYNFILQESRRLWDSCKTGVYSQDFWQKNSDCGLLVNASRAIIFASAGEDFAIVATKVAKEYQTEMKNYLPF
ncbi:MAG: hypothetical protein WCL46_10780 [Chlorobium sp.]